MPGLRPELPHGFPTGTLWARAVPVTARKRAIGRTNDGRTRPRGSSGLPAQLRYLLAKRLQHWSHDGVEVAPSTFNRIVWSCIEYCDGSNDLAEERRVLAGVLAETTEAAARADCRA